MYGQDRDLLVALSQWFVLPSLPAYAWSFQTARILRRVTSVSDRLDEHTSAIPV